MMKGKRLLSIFISLAVACGVCHSQDFAGIRKDQSFIYAEGTGADVNAADSSALRGIAAKLAQEIEWDYRNEIRNGLMLSYLDDIRRECGMISETGRKTAEVMRYIRKDDIDLIFSRRRGKVSEMVSIAGKAEGKCQVDVALRYYSWAETLMRSLPSPDAAAIAEVRSKRENILKKLKVTFDRQSVYDKGIVELTFTCGGTAVRSIDYRFYDGVKWSGILSAKDGKGFVEVAPDSKIDSYRIKYEIDPRHLQHLFREVSGVEKAFAAGVKGDAAGENPRNDSPATEAKGGKEPPRIKRESAEQKIDFSEVKKKVLDIVARDEFQTAADSARNDLKVVARPSDYEEIIKEICKSISGETDREISGFFTEEGYEIFNKLIRYGNARVLNFDRLEFYEFGDEVFCRSVPMVFSFKGNKRQFVEDVVFTFDSEKRIRDLTFALDRETARSIISQSGWTEEARLVLVNFIESYKTAYSLKRLDYLNAIFDDDALIITGRVLRNVKGPNEYSNNRYVTLTRQDKTTYIKNLRRVFASQEYINLQFSDCEVMKLGKGEQLFGIKIRQEYYSTTYSDSGYLFILVDLRDCRRPVIHVRTWQDEPDKDFGVIGPYNF